MVPGYRTCDAVSRGRSAADRRRWGWRAPRSRLRRHRNTRSKRCRVHTFGVSPAVVACRLEALPSIPLRLRLRGNAGGAGARPGRRRSRVRPQAQGRATHRPGERRPARLPARALAHVPEPKLHLVHNYSWYSNVSRGRRRNRRDAPLATQPSSRAEPDGLTPDERRARRRAWARLIRRVYETDPLI